MAKLRMCRNCRAFVPASERYCTECHEPLGQSYARRMATGAALAGLVPPTHFTTLIILMINGALFAAVLILSMKRADGDVLWSANPYVLYDFGAKETVSIFRLGQWWRLITAGFLHGGLLHFLMNSWALYDLGAQVEQAYGTARFLVFYLVSSIMGFVASSLWSPALSIGASAAIFGLIGAMIAYGYRHRTTLGVAMKAVYTRWAIYGLIFGLLPMFNIDNAAHIGGLVTGFVMGYVTGTPHYRAVEWLWRAAAAFLVLIAAVAFLFVWLAYPKA